MSVETTLEVVNDGLRLEGTLCRPSGADARVAVLLIAGSGPLDRDLNTEGIRLDIFNALAEQLADSGVTSLRVDKRGCGASEGVHVDTGHVELVDDAAAWFDRLREALPEAGWRFHVLGLSEGTLICPQLVARREGVAGQILVAPLLERFADAVERQNLAKLEELKRTPGLKGAYLRLVIRLSGARRERKQAAFFERVRSTDASSLEIHGHTFNVKWLREMDALDPLALHAAVDVPTLAIAAGKDVQCRPEDAERLRELRPDGVRAVTVPDLAHILRIEPGEPSLARYRELLEKPLDPRVGEIALAWLLEGAGSGTPAGAEATP